ncbi:MAG: thioredoxin family protein [Cytophagales bacterium]|nr:thioredoxin family protein [Cytophagales bacterium]
MMRLYTLLFLVFFIPSLSGAAQDWGTDLEQAKSLANAKKLPILLVFQGSDWCAPCIKLERSIWDSDEFIEYAKDNLVLVKADFPRKKKNRLSAEQKRKNGELAEIYNPGGHFPLVVLMNAEGKVYGKLGYEKLKPAAYILRIKSLVR